MARTTVNTPKENMVLSSPTPYGFKLPSWLKINDGLVVNSKAIKRMKKTIAYNRRVFNFIETLYYIKY